MRKITDRFARKLARQGWEVYKVFNEIEKDHHQLRRDAEAEFEEVRSLRISGLRHYRVMYVRNQLK